MAAGMQSAITQSDVTRAAAVARLREVGMGYIAFALAEPGWFSVAFFNSAQGLAQLDDAPPYVALVAALDSMAECGALTAAQRVDAEWPCWAAVHGFAEMALRGPLRDLPNERIRQLASRTINSVITGLVNDHF